ncbi:MAG: lytic murein transglycosylase [Paracoccaceae bacterium]
MRLTTVALAALLASQPALAAPCGGDFAAFLDAMATEASAAGASPDSVKAFFKGAAPDPAVLKADRSQGVFRKTFLDFSKSLISKNRLQSGLAASQKHDATFDRALAEHGVSRGILLAFWAFETDYGAIQGDFNTRNALLTLAHDCRRPDLFQPQVLAAITLTERGGMDPATTTGAWAGEIGMVQMLPADILERGQDGDGDGVVSLKTSPQDALLSGATLLQHHGWRAGEPWLQEITLPENLDWSLTGLDTALPTSRWAAMGITPRDGTLPNLPASVLLPQGRKGPAFLAYPNFRVLFDWNKSFVYVTTAAYFATRLEGAPPYDAGNPDPGLGPDDMKALQTKLAALGHDVGKIDGILGAATRTAVQKEQKRLNLPADAWPTAALLNAL